MVDGPLAISHHSTSYLNTRRHSCSVDSLWQHLPDGGHHEANRRSLRERPLGRDVPAEQPLPQRRRHASHLSRVRQPMAQWLHTAILPVADFLLGLRRCSVEIRRRRPLSRLGAGSAPDAATRRKANPTQKVV